ncbi:MAG: MFS transporter [Pseudomonadota bacterium]
MNRDLSKPTDARAPILMLAVLWLVGWTLRIHILAAPPLATRIADSFNLGEAGEGALTMLPILAVAFGAIPAAWIIARFGIRRSIICGLIIMTVASIARGQVPTALFLFFASIIMGFGVAIFQTALPIATRVWTPTHIALGSAVYLNGMMFGELSGAGLTLPIILPLAGGEWQIALVLWGIPTILVAMIVGILRIPASDEEVSHETSLPRWTDIRVWQYGILLASSAVAFLIVNAYSGSVLQSRDEYEMAGFFHFAYNATPLLASFVILIRPNWIELRAPIAISAIITILGMAGFLIFDGWLSWVFAMVVGFASTIELILIVSLPPAVAKGRAVTRLSAGMTLIGFTLAFLLTLVGGIYADASARVVLALMPSLLFMVVALGALGRSRHYPAYR